jgi:hypothetical protein
MSPDEEPGEIADATIGLPGPAEEPPADDSVDEPTLVNSEDV